MSTQPTRSKSTTFQQVCELIPKHLVAKLPEYDSVQVGTFTAWRHVGQRCSYN